MLKYNQNAIKKMLLSLKIITQIQKNKTKHNNKHTQADVSGFKKILIKVPENVENKEFKCYIFKI